MEKSTYDFFDLVLSGELGELDIDNYIENKTNGLNWLKLKLLSDDIEYCLFLEREQKESSYTAQDIENAIFELKKNKKEVPYITIPSIHNKEQNLISQSSQILNLEKLLFPYHFFSIYQLIERINFHIQKAKPPQQTETKTDKLKAGLVKYGFFELLNVKQLSEPNKQTLVELISKNPMPYGIAMFDYLGFCEYLDREQGTKYKADNILSKLFNENAKDGSSAKHYRRSLIKTSTRYKAGDYKEIVKTDYQKLK